jgi:hypothetical protein
MWKKSIAPLIALALALLVAHRIWRASSQPAGDWMESRSQLTTAAERELYLTPGGVYTQADIDANGRTTPSVRYANFQARHDLNPQPGDPLCPITRTKASPDCTWTIAGCNYQFCCPPCIDEMVRLAKQQPQRVQPPELFVQK